MRKFRKEIEGTGVILGAMRRMRRRSGEFDSKVRAWE
jgi:hypothetical protein